MLAGGNGRLFHDLHGAGVFEGERGQRLAMVTRGLRAGAAIRWVSSWKNANRLLRCHNGAGGRCDPHG